MVVLTLVKQKMVNILIEVTDGKDTISKQSLLKTKRQQPNIALDDSRINSL